MLLEVFQSKMTTRSIPIIQNLLHFKRIPLLVANSRIRKVLDALGNDIQYIDKKWVSYVRMTAGLVSLTNALTIYIIPQNHGFWVEDLIHRR